MSWLKNPKLLGWIESLAAIYGFHGVGWLAAGFWVQGVLRMIAGWTLFFVMWLTIFGLMDLFGSFLPSPYFLIPPALLSVAWPAAAIWSGIRLQKRLEQTHRTQTA